MIKIDLNEYDKLKQALASLNYYWTMYKKLNDDDYFVFKYTPFIEGIARDNIYDKMAKVKIAKISKKAVLKKSFYLQLKEYVDMQEYFKLTVENLIQADELR